MGILDDAIREHLELKRRRGADPAEIERLEHEALGPARGVPGTAGAVLESGPNEVLYEEPAEHWAEELDEPGEWEYEEPGEPPADGAQADAFAPGGREPIAADLAAADFAEPPPGETQLEPGLEAQPAPPPPASATPPPAAAPQPPAPPATDVPREPELGGETVEYDVEAEHRGEKPTQDDVLEETPEFLQDTPDHDRLWFEQRPPKDFDFDG